MAWHDMTWHVMMQYDITCQGMTVHYMGMQPFASFHPGWCGGNIQQPFVVSCLGMVRHGMAWLYMTCHGMPLHGIMTWHDMAWHATFHPVNMSCEQPVIISLPNTSLRGMAWWHGMAWYGMAWHGIAWHDLTHSGAMTKNFRSLRSIFALSFAFYYLLPMYILSSL